MRLLTKEQIEEILDKCDILNNARLPKDYDAGVAQGKREVGYKIIEIFNRDMPSFAEDFFMDQFRKKFPKQIKEEQES